MKVLLAALLVSAAATPGQEMDLGIGPAPTKGQQVQFVAEPLAVRAGRPEELELRFQVRHGYHVNSHAPKSELLLPTRVELAGAGVRVGTVSYPAGKPFRLGEELLDVYADEFTVRVPVTAVLGSHTLEGSLRYQACDRAACFPPRTLPVAVVFEAK